MSQSPPRIRRWIVLTLAAAAACPAVGRAAAITGPSPATAPSADTQKQIADTIEQLGSDDFKTREDAARLLWQFGDAAVPALKEATQSENPEISHRARSVLASFAYGIRPDTPSPVVEQLNLYRRGNDQEKRAALGELTRLGPAGARVLAKIAHDEQDPELRQIAMNGLTMVARPTTAAMIRQGDFEMAGNILAMVAHQEEAPARDSAAYLLLHGGIDDAIARLRRPSDAPAIPAAQLRLACLLRAKGDLPAAIKAAVAANNNPFAESLRVEAGDYANLAKDLEARGVADSSIEEMAFVMAYQRLAGHTSDVDRWANKIVEFSRANPATHRDASEALFLNERPNQAMNLLMEVKDPLLAMEYVGPRFDFKLTDQIVDSTRDDQSGDLAKVLAKSAPMLHHQGKAQEATDRLMAVSRGEHGPVDTACWEEVIEAAPMSGIKSEQVDKWLAQALTTANPRGELSPERLFRKALYLDPTHAVVWWEILRDHRMGMTSPGDITVLIRRLDRDQVKEEELQSLMTKVKAYAATLTRSERVRRLTLIGEVLSKKNRDSDALAIYEGLLPGPDDNSFAVPLYIHIGDLHAKAKRWEQAAEAYADASKANPSDPQPVALEGWARLQMNKAEDGRRLLDLAHLMPLGDESVRNELASALSERGIEAEARRERELTVLLGNPRSWAYCDALRRLAGDVNKKDPLTAAAMWDRAFLANLNTTTSFIDPTANLTVPVLVRRTKAIGHIRAGKIAEALDDAKFCLDTYPADADSQIAIVRELDKAGKKKEAETVYHQAFDRFDSIRKQFPESGQTNNLVAWMTACVKRDLDHGLTCAKKAVELEPENTAILDTLSEVYFARGEYDEALKINEKCRTMEPYIEHHKKNQERFTAAKQGKKVEGASPGDDD